MAGTRCVVTYNGIDGACAAAAVLLRYPDADVRITSAARVGRTMQRLARSDEVPEEVHVCGVGVWCDWEEMLEPARVMAADGTEIRWYCGRGYLEKHRGRFESVCNPVFYKLGTNTEAVCKYLSQGDVQAADRLCRLATHDPHNEAEPVGRGPSEQQRWWMDFIEASISQYFKYQDIETYERAIRQLAANKIDHQDEQLVEVFRRKGNRHVLRGKSQPMRRLREMIRRCAEVDEHVLITGESGVGKEYVAHLLHERSRRAMGPMIPVNCAVFAGNEGLANSVLFGHKKGAFTGATADRDGAFVTADSGMLFLDEVGELPPQVQAKFLRVLEDGLVTPEGADKPEERVDVRVVAATKRDLVGMVRERTFRDDLYHRLDTLHINVPPLRDHPGDIPEIAEYAVDDLEEEELTETALEMLERHPWPGNVRQLIKVLKRMAYLEISLTEALSHEECLTVKEPPNGGEAESFLPETRDDIRSMDWVKSAYAARALETNDNNKSDTARRLDISPNTLKAYLEIGEKDEPAENSA